MAENGIVPDDWVKNPNWADLAQLEEICRKAVYPEPTRYMAGNMLHQEEHRAICGVLAILAARIEALEHKDE